MVARRAGAIGAKAAAARLPVTATLLGFPAPRMRVYPPQTVVAEKLEAMVRFGIANSRMKDFFDLAAISNHFEFQGEDIASAIAVSRV